MVLTAPLIKDLDDSILFLGSRETNISNIYLKLSIGKSCEVILVCSDNTGYEYTLSGYNYDRISLVPKYALARYKLAGSAIDFSKYNCNKVFIDIDDKLKKELSDLNKNSYADSYSLIISLAWNKEIEAVTYTIMGSYPFFLKELKLQSIQKIVESYIHIYNCVDNSKIRLVRG